MSSSRRSSARAPSRIVTATVGILFSATASHGSDLVEADPQVAEHDRHQRRQVQKEDQPRVEPAVGSPAATHQRVRARCRSTSPERRPERPDAGSRRGCGSVRPTRSRSTISGATSQGAGRTEGSPLTSARSDQHGDQGRDRGDGGRDAAVRRQLPASRKTPSGSSVAEPTSSSPPSSRHQREERGRAPAMSTGPSAGMPSR